MKKIFKWEVRYAIDNSPYSWPAYVDAENLNEAVSKFKEENKNCRVLEVTKLHIGNL